MAKKTKKPVSTEVQEIRITKEDYIAVAANYLSPGRMKNIRFSWGQEGDLKGARVNGIFIPETDAFYEAKRRCLRQGK